MSVMKLWENSRDEIAGKSVSQIIAFCADGVLKDDSETSAEFREFISVVPTSFLTRYVEECIRRVFPENGFVLQDLVNEIGKRLGFKVHFGRYRGVRNEPGFDGIWIYKQQGIVVEVKTTDAYRINLDKYAGYKDSAVQLGLCNEKDTSILIVVLRTDTGDVEAQIRGSRYAWDCRLIGVDSLLKMLEIKESSEETILIDRIRSLLVPQEYTRLDSIVEIALTAIYEGMAQAEEEETADKGEENAVNNTDAINRLHELCISKASEQLGGKLLRKNRSLYATEDDKIHLVCKTSKRHDYKDYSLYWFGYRFNTLEALENSERSYIVLGCLDPDRILLIPAQIIHDKKDKLNVTRGRGVPYYHLKLVLNSDSDISLQLNDSTEVSLNEYLVK